MDFNDHSLLFMKIYYKVLLAVRFIHLREMLYYSIGGYLVSVA